MLGILGHTFIVAKKINKRLGVKDIDHVFGEVWKLDYKAIIRGLFFYLVLLFIASDYINISKIEKPDYTVSIPERIHLFRIGNFIRTCSVVAGYFSESIVYGIFGIAEEMIKKKKEQFLKIIGDDPNVKKQ